MFRYLFSFQKFLGVERFKVIFQLLNSVFVLFLLVVTTSHLLYWYLPLCLYQFLNSVCVFSVCVDVTYIPIDILKCASKIGYIS